MAPTFDFTSDPTLSSFAVNLETFVANDPGRKTSSGATIRFQYVAVGAIVFDSSSDPERVLLVQRAATDSAPNRWEVPGGATDFEDPSILHSVARELWEESGLTGETIGPRVGDGDVFLTRSGKLVCKFHFLVEAKRNSNGALNVVLDPKEHQNYLWATEEEVKARRVGDVDLKFTTKEQEVAIIKGFEARRRMKGVKSNYRYNATS
ncbi:uncharacterized protein PV06_01670 [Exophiala oligosperma]|uniref:Nudix hydrolase domain-containing protein n=2 Tax=Chaetothyriales TaxID=34395 RepID=A0A0D2EDI2_9EURO|nr:uncharacterized protein PV06_01670 [Exophiala oligosperma]KAJ9617744.1 hypothetical protein H2204_013497 [Knufia peltigerae]KIW45974.1 hypothetical protein PV06_01670 [Exophiala oligosperma]